MESAAWSGWVKRLFKRHHGEEIAPKTLRSVFITWLRDQTTAPDILKSAAHAMKHSEQRQGSADYDQESDDRLVKAAYEFNLTYASGFTAESGSSGGEGSSSAAPPPPAQHASGEDSSSAVPPPPLPPPAQPMQQQQPPAATQPNVDTQMLPPMSIAQLTFQLEGVGFARSSADKNGDCFPLSAMAGFEITAAAARKPTAATTAKVRQVREDAIDRLAGDAAIGGIDAAVFRAGERLSEDAAAAAAAMAAWREPGFWHTNQVNKSATFQLGVGLELGRPIAVIQKSGRIFLDPTRIYGARNADGTLVHSEARPGAPETVPTFTLMPIATLIQKLRDNPVAYSVVEHNGSNHFQPWILKPALRKAANAAAAALAARPAEVAPAAAVAGGVQGSASVASGAQEAVADDEAAVEDEEGEWVELDGAPFTAHLVKGGPRTTAPTRSYKIIIPFSDETPIYSGGKIKLPIVPGAPAEGIVLPMPLLPPVGAKELTFTLKLDRAGATADAVTINSALYWKRTAAAAQAAVEAEAEPEADTDAEVEAAPEQLSFGDND